MGLFSWLFSSSGKDGREAAAPEGAVAKGKGTRADGSPYFQDEVHNIQNGFRVQRGAKGEKRVAYPLADGGYVKKRKGG
jgi:hypothetical protein